MPTAHAQMAGVLLALLIAAGAASAKLCGDDVQGQDVPCACGDTVVSSLALSGADPVVQGVCPRDGLIVRATAAAQGVTIDLKGQTLRGSGYGSGIWLVQGGPGGARVTSSVGTATMEGFRDGVSGRGPNSVALVENVRVVGSRRDGVRLNATGYTVRTVEVVESGRDGFWLRGSGFEVTGTRAMESGRFGYFVMGTQGLLGNGAAALASGSAGFSLMGMGHVISGCEATGNGKDGIQLNGMHYEILGCTVQGNGMDGISGTGMDVMVAGSQAVGNENNGIAVKGVQIADGGGNMGSGNQGSHQRRPAIQCQLGRVACQP